MANWQYDCCICVFHVFPLIQGGTSTGYKKFVSENDNEDDTYSESGVALFRVQGSGPENMQAIQVDTVLFLLIFSRQGIMVVLWPCYLNGLCFYYMAKVMIMLWFLLPGSIIAELFLLLHTTRWGYSIYMDR